MFCVCWVCAAASLGVIGHGVYIGCGVHMYTSMIYVHTCTLTGRKFSRSKHTLMCLDVLFLLKYLNTFDNEAEGTIIIYSFIECSCYDLKDIDVNH